MILHQQVTAPRECTVEVVPSFPRYMFSIDVSNGLQVIGKMSLVRLTFAR